MAKVLIEIGLDLDNLKKGLKKAATRAKKTGKKLGDTLGKNIKRGLDNGLKNLTKRLKAIGKAGKRLGRNLKKNLGNAFKSLTGRLVAFGAVLAAAFGGRAIIAAAARQEDAINKINTALRLSGKFTEAASKGLQDYASQLQSTTKFGDELVLETAALIQSLGALEVDGLKKATSAAADLSAALGIDLKAAALLVGKAAAGEVSSFSRYGLIIKKGATNAETFAIALDALNSKFGGAAAAQINTFSGASEQLSNAFGDVLEGLGGLITKSPIIVNSIKLITKELLKSSKALSETRIDPRSIESGISSLINFAKAGIFIFGGLFEFVARSVNAVSEVITVFVTDAISRVLNFGSQALAIAGKFSDKFKVMSETLARQSQTFAQVSEESTDKTKEAFAGLFDFSVTQKAIEGLNIVKDAVLEANDAMGKSFDDLNDKQKKVGESDAPKSLAERWEKASESITKSLQNGILKVATTVFAKLGAVLAGAEFNGKKFVNTLLGILGTLAINTGAIILAMGLGIGALKVALGTLNPFLAIAAGASLIALGGALKALSSGSGGEASAGGGVAAGGGGGIDAGGEGSIELGSAAREEREEQGTQVNIVVQGNILDRRETGLELAEIINESFNSNGVVITQAG